MSRFPRQARSYWTGTTCVLGASVLYFVPQLTWGAEVDFGRDIYPVLKASCISCHNKTTTKAGLNMETPEMMTKGGDSGPAIVSGKGAESLIVLAAAHKDDMEMPPKNNKTGAVNLTSAELNLVKTWIDQGAKGSTLQERRVVWQPLPPGVEPIYTVALTKDGRFAACGRGNQVFIYDLATRQFVTRISDKTPGSKEGEAHRALVQSVTFSPDGERLASGSFREVKIWRREKAQAVTRKSDAALGAVVSELSTDGKQLIVADKQGALHLLEAGSGKVIKTIPAVNAAGIKLLSVSPDYSKVSVHGADATLSVWNLQDGTRIANLPGVNGARALVWTGDGKAIAAAGEDKIVRVWALPAAGNTELAAPKEFKGSTGAITALVPTGSDRLLAASADGKVRLWNLVDVKMLKEFAIPGVLSIAASRDGKQLAAGCADGAVRVWDFAAAKQVIELRGDVKSSERIASLEWAVAAQGLDLASHTQEAARIEAQNKALDELLKKANETIASVKKVLPEKQMAAEAATEKKVAAQKAADDVAALIAKAPDGKPDAALETQSKDAQTKLTAATDAATSAVTAFEASQNHIKDAEAEIKRITETKTRNSAAITAANAAVAAAKQAQAKATAELAAVKQAVAKGGPRPLDVAFSADGQALAAIFDDGAQRLWAISSGLPIDQVFVSGATASGSVTASGSGGFVACNAEGATAGVSTESKWVLERALGGDKPGSPFVDRVNAVRFSPDGKTLAVGGGEPSRSGDISLWDVPTGKVVHTWDERHKDAVLSLDFSHDGKLLASGGADRVARVTEIATGKQVRLFEGHTHHVMGVNFRADGRVLASAGADNAVIVWDMSSGERKKKIEGWVKEVTSLQFIGATTQMVTSAGDNRIRLVKDDGAAVREISKLPEFMQSAASTSSASVIIGGGEDGILRVWDGSNGHELAVFGAR